MTKNKLAIIGGSGLYEIEGLENPKWKSISTPWGKPSDEILNFKYKEKEVLFFTTALHEDTKFPLLILTFRG